MKRFLIIFTSILCSLYLLFLVMPIFLTPVLRAYSGQIETLINENTGLDIKINKISIISTPKLTLGVKIKNISASIPSNENFLICENLRFKLAILPLLTGKIKADVLSFDKISTNAKIRQDGHFLFEEFIINQDLDKKENTSTLLPFGLKLSNSLPTITIKQYDISIIDMPSLNKYTIVGNNFKISNFVLNKKIKLIAKGKFNINGSEQIVYHINILNKIMPFPDINDLLSNCDNNAQSTNQTNSINISQILNTLNTTKLSADIKTKLNISGTINNPKIYGNTTINNLTLLLDGKFLPESTIYAKNKSNNLKITSELNSGENEKTNITVDLTNGKKLNLKLISNAQVNNLIKIANSIIKNFGYTDLQYITANGNIDANFNLKATKNKVNSSGYFKIPNANITYQPLNLSINNIKSEVTFDNCINIKSISFNILGQPLNISGTIDKNSTVSINIKATNMPVKGLVATTGQLQIIKDNIFNSGKVSLLGKIEGNLKKIRPSLNIFVNNLNVKNIQSSTTITMPEAKFSLDNGSKTISGELAAKNIYVFNPTFKIKLPNIAINVNQKDININSTYMLLNNSRIDISGQIKNYADKCKIKLDANGLILANDIYSMLPKGYSVSYNGKLPLKINVSGDKSSQDINISLNADNNNYIALLPVTSLKGNSTLIKSNIKLINDTAKITSCGIFINNISNPLLTLTGTINNLSKSPTMNLSLDVPKYIKSSIPTLKNSEINMRGQISVTGDISNPYLKGIVNIQSLNIPDMCLNMKNTILNLNGNILKGNATSKKLSFGEITAENITAEISLKNYVQLSIRNIIADAFSGKLTGNISYNISNGKIVASFIGNGMNAVNSIKALSGIDNALSGMLNFKANISTHGFTNDDILNNLNGKITFKITDGKFLNVGRFDNLLYAKNIVGNTILKTTVTSVTNIPIVQNTAEFKTIDGLITIKNRYVYINSIKTTGQLMAYYITGKYNLFTAATDLVILGRLDGKVVSALGPLGDLSVDKLTSYIPKFGTLTSMLIKEMTTNPRNENVANIPKLTTGSTNYKDFKVIYNGGIGMRSSIMSFKWLSNCDTSAIDIKKEYSNMQNGIKNTLKSATQDITDANETLKNTINNSKQQFDDAKEELKNLFQF